ncbi:MAG: molybdopterin molybdotransferase [Flavobacteriaceae bacterium]|jgi:molybdopterin molybdotransferase
MISVTEALQIVQNNIKPTTEIVQLDLSKANKYILAEDIVSEINMPPFRQSAMDGYALCLNNELNYQLIGEVKAGDNAHPVLKKGEAVRIFTGAPVPDTANAVIMQELVHVNNDSITISKVTPLNSNIRPLGEQVVKGQIALEKGTTLTPAAIGYLTSLGIEKIEVYKKPSIAILVTGNELISAGTPLKYGQIYESNAAMLKSALITLGFQQIKNYKVSDNYQDTLKVLENIISKHDVILVSGGISVGDYDFVGKALKELEVKELFYKVKQKPGKPLFFGKKNDKVIFALPGNPGAALTCFYIYVQLALQKLSGNQSYEATRLKAKSKSEFIKKGDRAQFLKAIYKMPTVEILEGQNSSMLHTFASGNALVYLSEEKGSININDEVEVILLPIS